MAKLMDTNGGDPTLKALLFGPSGSGKTAFGCTAPKPLILLSERQGEATIRKRSKELGIPMPAVVVMETVRDYACAVKALHGDKSKPFRWIDGDGNLLLELEDWPETVVLDSVTDACEMVRHSVEAASPPKKGDDGLPVFSQRHWAALRERCERMFRAFRDVPVNVIFLALMDERLSEASDGVTTRTIGPAVPMRALPDVLMAATNVAGMIVRKSRKVPGAAPGADVELHYTVRTNGPSFYKVKPFRPLGDEEVAHFGQWLEKINAPAPKKLAAAAAKKESK